MDRRSLFDLNPWRLERELRHLGLRFGIEVETGQSVYLSPKWLETHLHVIGPPGVGKSRLLLQLFQLLIRVPKATVVLLNPKGELGNQARDVAIAAGRTRRLIVFDPSDEDAIFGYNPLRPNGLPIATHAKAVREGIRSAWGQASFDQTPQLARFLYLVLFAVRERGLTLVEAVNLLRPGSTMRSALLTGVQDLQVREALQYLDSLREARQDELLASTLARLESFVLDPTIRRILTQQARALDLGAVLDDHKILILNLEQYRPLRPDDVKLLGRLFVNDLLAHVFARPKHKRTPVYFLIDEVQTFATEDLCTALEQGRELGFHCVLAHQELGQLRVEEGDRRLLQSVMNCARTRALFGGNWVQDLRPLVEELFLEDYDPMEVKDELTSLELDPIESKRVVKAHGKHWSWSTSSGSGTSSATTEGKTDGVSLQKGTAKGQAHAVSSGQTIGTSAALGEGQTILPGGEMVSSHHDSAGSSEASFTGETEVTSESVFQSSGLQHSDSKSKTEGKQTSFSSGFSYGGSGSESEVPFYEYRKRRVVSSRTFLSEQEFLTLCLQKVKRQPKGHFVLKVPGHSAVFLKAPWIEPPQIGRVTRAKATERIKSQPFYSTPAEIEAEEQGRRRLLSPQEPREPENPEDFFAPRT